MRQKDVERRVNEQVKEKKTNNYIHKCEPCGKEFDLYKGEGWGESYNAGGMLPKTRYVCMECVKSRKEQAQ